MRHAVPLALTLLACALNGAHAEAPMTTEHAAPLAPGECEWELAHSRATAGGVHARGWVTNAGCALTQGLDIGLAWGRSSAQGVSTQSVDLYGRLTLLSMGEDALHVGLVYGVGALKQSGRGLRHDSTSLTLAATQPLSAQLLVHGNLGVSRAKLAGETTPFWAVGAEWSLNETVALLAESYGSRNSKPSYGVGVRWLPAANWAFGLMGYEGRGADSERGITLTAQRVF